MLSFEVDTDWWKKQGIFHFCRSAYRSLSPANEDMTKQPTDKSNQLATLNQGQNQKNVSQFPPAKIGAERQRSAMGVMPIRHDA